MSPISPRSLARPRRAILLAHAEHGERGEDRFAANPARGRWVLCDGASEGWDSGGFASCLAAATARLGPGCRALAEAREAFAGRAAGGDWLSDRARARGSFSTLLAVEVLPGGRLLRASAVGDTELFVLDGARTVAAWPVGSAEAFGDSPELLGDGEGEDPAAATRVFSLARLRHPSFALLTDALAARMLGAEAAEAALLWRFFALASAEAFSAWARDEMEEGRLRRDDLTLLWLR